MRETFRLSMAYLHTWLGLVLGFVLMAVFFFGSLSVFDREIDRWSIPETRAAAAPFPSFDQTVRPLIDELRPRPIDMAYAQREVIGPLPPAETLRANDIFVATGHRDPLVRLYPTFDVPNAPRDPKVDHAHVHGYAAIDPQSGTRLPSNLQERLALGTGFFFPMHFMLHIEWLNLGIWIVGLAGMAMLAALVSGVILHRRIFREFFTFRVDKPRLRSTLDLHNLTGVVALPFLFFITLSGLLIFAFMYFPASNTLMYPLMKAQEKVEESRTGLPADPAGQPGSLASVDAMMAAAQAHWAAKGVPGEIGSVAVTHIGDANAYVSIGRDNVDRVATSETLHFKGTTGALLYEDPPAHPIEATRGFLYGMHFQQFKHWGLRWLLFAGGLLGCACIATGFLFFVEKRKKKHAAAGVWGARIVDALAVAAIPGMLVATTAMMLASKLLPSALQHNETGWLQPVFWLTWLTALIHAAARSAPLAAGGTSRAWAEQAAVAAVLAVAAVIANGVITGDHLLKTIAEGYWPVAGVDLVLLVGAAVAGWTAIRLGILPGAPRSARPSAPELAPAE
jgi:uncharacterized iron-regulated membrane protein